MTIMLRDLCGGLAPEKDMVFPGKPADPEMRESTSVWLYEENGAFAFPRGGIEAEASSWDNRTLQANFSFPDGRVLDGAGRGAATSPVGPDGKPTVLGAGPLTFRCVEPFRRWTMTFDGPARDGQVSEMIAGTFGGRGTTHVRLEADMTMVTPAWVQENSTDTSNMTKKQAEDAAAMGLGYRFEHLFRAEGTLQVDGKTRNFKATGLRIHRQSIRRLAGFIGHCWQSAVFPDGRAFGLCVYPPPPDGAEPYNDAYIFQDGRMITARATKVPFLRRIVATGDDVSFELESELGRTHIEGTTAFSTYRMNVAEMGGLNLQQGGALYRWDGQSAYGMIERSSHASLTTIG